ncbi:MAG: molybdenum cofactor guanylyltransferase, partial [Planctomycetota bacterium]
MCGRSSTRRIGGLVLCGGRSRRMGRDKAWLPFGPETLLQRMVRIVGEVASPLLVAARPDQELPHLPPEVRAVHD